MSRPPDIDAVLDRVDAGFTAAVERLAELVRIPSCSFPGFDPGELERSAEATAAWARDAGFPEVEILRGEGPPYVLAHDRRAGADAPTVLLYAHHDVQPPGDDADWETPPYQPSERGGRLYGRGSADDKAGIAATIAAYAAWTADGDHPPCNVTLWVEGEEEVGSPHLAAFVAEHLERLRADAILIADVGNVQTGVPTLTMSLRGMVSCFVTLRALRGPLHSGMWGGPTPEPVGALCRLLGSLADDRGGIDWPGLAVPEPSVAALADLERVPFDRDALAASMGALPEAAALLPDGPATYRSNWYEPIFSINAIHAGGDRGSAGNVINGACWARISLRTVPGMAAAEAQQVLEGLLRERCPEGFELTIEPEQQAEAWSTATDHPLFASCREAFARGYGREAVTIGCGGSIPFVGMLSERLGGIPALLIPVEDPDSRPHAENESVHLEDLRKSTRSIAAFLALAADAR